MTRALMTTIKARPRFKKLTLLLNPAGCDTLRHMTARIDVIFCCPNCDLIYQATQERAPGRGGRFDCMKCNAEIHRWSGEYDFVVWRPLSERVLKRPKV